MFSGLSILVSLVVLALWVVAFGLSVFGLVDAGRRPAGAFVAAGKQTKQRWLIILGVATALSFVSMPLFGQFQTLGFLNLISVVAAAVYMVDVRPAVRPYKGQRGGGSSGPYGPW